ncbi:aminotransferase class III-fold pyridoxal phosphate-dependent enzyme [Microbispora hainanensis]|uniref:aspartate aminotransferase family protein n=1 Tax=Microbispora hainanensis TaxID=568844 RepID=UPI0033DCC29F
MTGALTKDGARTARDPGRSALGTTAGNAARDAFRRVQRHFSPAVALAGKFAGQGAAEAAASGAEITLTDGRRMLDFGSYAVTLLGHRHPAVTEAVRRQLDAMPVSSRSLVNPVTAEAAERLSEHLGGRLRRVYFGVNGSDAVEVAVKLARLASGRPRVLAVRGAFHGKSLGALALTHHGRFRAGLEPVLPHATHLDPRDPDAVRRACAEGDVAAVVFEPVQGENGVVPLDPGVLARWCEDAHAAGAFAIADEIQTGLRRAGEPSLALHAGLPVDAVLLGKPLGGGVVPISAAVCSDELYRPLLDDPFRHSATFAGQPLCAAAVPAALAAVEGLAGQGETISGRLRAGLAELRRTHPDAVTGTRGRGLLWGVDFASPELSGEVQIGLAQRGLLVSPCLSRPETLRLLPPLVATRADVERAFDALSAAVGAAAVEVSR